MAVIEVYTKYGLNHSPEVQGEYNFCGVWCKENCCGYYRYDYLPSTTRWVFEDETDAMAFKLRWT